MMSQQFEQIKRKLEETKIKKITAEASQAEKQRRLGEIKDKIKSEYGVEIEDFDEAITILEDKLNACYQEVNLKFKAIDDKLEDIK